MMVFLQTSIARLPMSEDVFKEMEGMFDKRSHRCFRFFNCQDSIFLCTLLHLFDRSSTLRDLPINSTSGILRLNLLPLFNSHITGIGMHLCFAPMQ